jgi:DHA3 family macrolide efflux protein-like MFS transporter
MFIAGQQATAFGSMMVQIAVLWSVARAAESGWMLTPAVVSALAPQAVVSLFSGVLSDRLPRKLLIVGSDLVIALASGAMIAALAAGVDGLWFIFAASAVRSAFAGLQGPAMRAVLPQIAPDDQLMRLNGIGEGVGSARGIVAPLLGGVLMATVGLEAVLAIDVATAVVGIALIASVPMRAATRGTEASDAKASGADESASDGMMANLRGGFAYLRDNKPVKWLIILGLGGGFFATVPMVMAILLVVSNFGGHQWALSGLEMSFSAGYLVGAGVIAAFATRLMRNRTRFLLAWMGAAALATVAMGLTPRAWVLLALMFVFSAAIAFWMTPYYTFLQERVAEDSAGRVFGIQEALDAASAPVALLIFGPLADRFCVEAILMVVGALTVAWLAAVLATPAARRALASFDVAPSSSDGMHQDNVHRPGSARPN